MFLSGWFFLSYCKQAAGLSICVCLCWVEPVGLSLLGRPCAPPSLPHRVGGEWRRLPRPSPGTAVLLFGICTAWRSNERIPAAEHRVADAPAAAASQRRMSAVLFVGAQSGQWDGHVLYWLACHNRIGKLTHLTHAIVFDRGRLSVAASLLAFASRAHFLLAPRLLQGCAMTPCWPPH